MNTTTTSIPLFGLYGDVRNSSDPGFVHIEEISDRSEKSNWIIEPHRHNQLFQILCVFNTEMELTLEKTQHTLEGSWAVTVPVGFTHGFRFQPNCQGFVLSVSDTIFSDDRLTGSDIHNSEIFHLPQIIRLPTSTTSPLQQYIDLIQQELTYPQHGQQQSLAMLTRLTLLTLIRMLQQKEFHITMGLKDSTLLGKFRGLLENHYNEHWTVNDYAEALHTSTATLNRLCHKWFGSSPKAIIQERVLTEVKRRLIHTRQPLAEIAYELGFKDYPYFSRYFKRLEGVSAGNYRKQSDTPSPPQSHADQ